VAHECSNTHPDAASHAFSKSWTHAEPYALSYTVAHAGTDLGADATTHTSTDLGTHGSTDTVAHGIANYSSADTAAHPITNPIAIIHADASANVFADISTYARTDQMCGKHAFADRGCHTDTNIKPH
jgi:hypothetical protein